MCSSALHYRVYENIPKMQLALLCRVSCMIVCVCECVCLSLLCVPCLDWLLKAKVKNATQPAGGGSAAAPTTTTTTAIAAATPATTTTEQAAIAARVSSALSLPTLFLFGCIALHGRKPIQCSVAALLQWGRGEGGGGREEGSCQTELNSNLLSMLVRSIDRLRNSFAA